MDKLVFVDQLKKKQVFWSYSNNADIPDGIVVEHTLKYGDVLDIIELFKIFSNDFIVNIWLQTMSQDSRFEKTNYYLKIFFLKDVQKHKTVESRYEKIKRVSERN
jgi:hypothetical protein